MTKPLVSLITLNYNRKELVQKTLKSFQNQTYSNCEIIMVDAGSLDGSVTLIKKRFPKVKIVGLPRNMGVAGMNEGMKVAKGRDFVLTDSDASIDENAVEKVVERFERNKKLGIVAFKFIDVDTNEIMSNPSHSRGGDLKNGYRTAYFNGGAFGYRRAAFEKVGGFSEKYFLYINEMRLAAKLANDGYEVRYFPDLVIWHKMKPNPTRKTTGKILMARNTFWYAISFMPLAYIPKVLWWFLFGFVKGTTTGHARPYEYLKGAIGGVLGVLYALAERKPVSKEYADEVIRTTLLTDGYEDKW